MRFPVNYIDVKYFFDNSNNIFFGYCPENPYVYSIDDGVVIYSHYQTKYSNVVFIKHDNGLISMYKRLENVTVETGQKVKNGDIIGEIGSAIGSNKKFLIFGLFSEKANYFEDQSDLDAFDYLYLYPNQYITTQTSIKYGVKLKYHKSYFNKDGEDNILEKNISMSEINYNNNNLLLRSNLTYGIFLIFIFILSFVIILYKKRNRG